MKYATRREWWRMSAWFVVPLWLFVTGTTFAGGAIESAPSELQVNYRFDQEARETSYITISALLTEFGIGINSGGWGSYDQRLARGAGGVSVDYQIVDSRYNDRVVKDLDGDPSGDSLLSGRSWWGKTQVPVTIVVPTGQLVRAGVYSDGLGGNIYTKTLNNPVQTQPIPTIGVAINVLPYLDIGLVNPGGTFDTSTKKALLDFGVLEEGDRRDVNLLVRANVPYSIRVASDYGGVLHHDAGLGDVPYTLSVNDAPVFLSNHPALVAHNQTRINAEGEPFHFSFEVGSTKGAPAGDYSDTLTITVTTS